MFPGARSCRSASLRLRFLKNQLRRESESRRRLEGAPSITPGAALLCPGVPRSACSYPSPRRVPTHGSGSRLFALATKLKGMKPSWPVVRDCAFHHSPFLRTPVVSVARSAWTRLDSLPPEPSCQCTPPSSSAPASLSFCLKGAYCQPVRTCRRAAEPGVSAPSLPHRHRARRFGMEGTLTAPGHEAVHPFRIPGPHRERAHSCAGR